MNWETIVVAVIVLVTASWAARSIYRSWKKGAVCSSCADSADCPMSKGGAGMQLTDLKDLKDMGPAHTCKH